MVLASLLLYLVFVAASMALARRIGGRAAALVTGLYLALGPKFLTTFSLNCVGQYVDVLALGGVALALLARDARRRAAPGASARVAYSRHRPPARSGLLAAAGGARLRGRRRPGAGPAPPHLARPVDGARAAGVRRWACFPCCSGTSQNGWGSSRHPRTRPARAAGPGGGAPGARGPHASPAPSRSSRASARAIPGRRGRGCMPSRWPCCPWWPSSILHHPGFRSGRPARAPRARLPARAARRHHPRPVLGHGLRPASTSGRATCCPRWPRSR